ncbi:MAG: hypothetical protein K2P79_14025 [Sphingomonas sp.]|nr:hypothetical protein [Sphingomonas sp.]
MTNACSFITLAVASVRIDADQRGKHSAMSHLVAIAVLIAERNSDGTWGFSLKRHAVGAGDREDSLLLWALNALPQSGIVIGWQLADRAIAPLLDAATTGDPELGRAFLDRLTRLVTAPSIDLAIHHGGAGAPPLAEVAAGNGIEAPAADPAAVESAWGFGERAWLRDHVEAEAVAVWRLWLAESNGTAKSASDAFDAWRPGSSDAAIS